MTVEQRQGQPAEAAMANGFMIVRNKVAMAKAMFEYMIGEYGPPVNVHPWVSVREMPQ
jgi:hypothetical protein